MSVFLTPRQINISSALFSKSDNVSFYQSTISLERKRCIIAYGVPRQEDFEECILDIQYPSKFYQLKHSSILGAVLNCGVKREFIGDIITDGTHWQMIVAKSIVPFLKQELTTVGRAKVTLKESASLLLPVDTAKVMDTLVSSQRLDVIIATAFNMSRNIAKELVEQGAVSLNWSTCDKADMSVEEKDMISVRGYGRVLLQSLNGVTQKGKIKATIHLYRNKK